ncbi:MAG: hypothetical protein O3C43_18825 [Verrucomicrobia bacterium]|nr:hypothetical protein [Verrucomicrobiota bacterium]MDA1068542.1 hypothetical protein [Verrucomicrobiota bacterium]
MKNPKSIFLLSLTAFLFGCLSPLVAQENAESEKVTLLVVVSDSLISHRAYHNDLDMYLRIKNNFTKAFEKEDWPVILKFERWSASIPDDGLQLRIWFKSLEEETLNDLVFRAWVTLLEDGEKTDFKIIKARTYPRPGRHPQDNMDEVILLAAEEVAKKLNEHKFNKP